MGDTLRNIKRIEIKGWKQPVKCRGIIWRHWSPDMTNVYVSAWQHIMDFYDERDKFSAFLCERQNKNLFGTAELWICSPLAPLTAACSNKKGLFSLGLRWRVSIKHVICKCATMWWFLIPLQISITLQCSRSSTVSLFTSFILMMYPLNGMKKAPEIWMIVEEKSARGYWEAHIPVFTWEQKEKSWSKLIRPSRERGFALFLLRRVLGGGFP